MTAGRHPPRRYVSSDFRADRLEDIDAVLDELETREVQGREQRERWCRDWSELMAILDEEGSRRFVAHTCHTDDAASKKRYIDWIERVEPRLKLRFFTLSEKLATDPRSEALPVEEFGIWLRSARNTVEVFRPENVPLETEVSKLDCEYDEVFGAMTVRFDGEERTLPQMNRVLEENDRSRRERAYRGIWGRILEDAERIEKIFDRQIALRDECARNAGLPDFRALRFRQLERFDYTPEDCLRFHDAIERVAVELVKKRRERRRQRMGLETLRPWDINVDPDGQPPLQPFNGQAELAEGCLETFRRIDPALGAHFEELMHGELLDLESRKGKAPGGYQCTYQESRVPFIFMNAAGLQQDIETLLHEGGHAFHTFEARSLDLCPNRGSPIEFAEVASTSMELLGAPHLDVFYDDPDAVRRARIKHLDGVLDIFPWVACIDGFQHWVYTHPGHSREQRREAWLEIRERFSLGIDMSGLDEIHGHRWIRQSHLFGVPFYYIEYAIAQLGALQVWRNYRKDPAAAIGAYRRALALGNRRPLKELFEAAEIRFDFSEEILGELLGLVHDEIEALERA